MKESQAHIAAPLLPFAGTSLSFDQLESSHWHPRTMHGEHPSHVPGTGRGHPLWTDCYLKSHQQIHRVSSTASETKLQG